MGVRIFSLASFPSFKARLCHLAEFGAALRFMFSPRSCHVVNRRRPGAVRDAILDYLRQGRRVCWRDTRGAVDSVRQRGPVLGAESQPYVGIASVGVKARPEIELTRPGVIEVETVSVGLATRHLDDIGDAVLYLET